jgi:peptide deformylase
MTDRNSIVTLPHDRLRERSKRVGIVNKEIEQIVADMEQATLDWEKHRQHELGVALAAVQIDQLLRIVIIRSNLEDKKDTRFNCYINPEITKKEGAVVEDFEGCLSIKDVYGKVPRYERVKVKALDINGQPVRLTAEGFVARVFQHEIDHTHGKLFIDHIKEKPEAFYRLGKDGKLAELDYEKDIKNSRILW